MKKDYCNLPCFQEKTIKIIYKKKHKQNKRKKII